MLKKSQVSDFSNCLSHGAQKPGPETSNETGENMIMLKPSKLSQVKLARDVSPNRGFLKQLVQFERELGRI